MPQSHRAYWEWEEDPPIFFGFGSASTITEYELTPEEEAALAKKQPIGFLHFPERDET